KGDFYPLSANIIYFIENHKSFLIIFSRNPPKIVMVLRAESSVKLFGYGCDAELRIAIALI
ncbi:MAG: hypothetical protein J6R93_06925, partial [Tidjanibacter sp.]|nr:hypothetical protein [Tidjanibacter sp.]